MQKKNASTQITVNHFKNPQDNKYQKSVFSMFFTAAFVATFFSSRNIQ